MKNSILLIVMLIFFTVFLIGWRTVELTATWRPNTERDMSHYNLYRYCQGNYQRINDAPIMHPSTSYKFTLKLSDDSTKHCALQLLRWIVQTKKAVTQKLFALRSDDKDGRPVTVVSSHSCGQGTTDFLKDE